MSKESIEIPLVKATYEELQQVICELQVERYKYKSVLYKIKEYAGELRLFDNESVEFEISTKLFKILEEIE